MIVPMIVSGLIDGLIGGISAYSASKQQSAAAQAQADQVKQNVQQVKDLINSNEISMEDGLKRIDTLINSTKGELKNVLEKQADIASKQIQKQYSQALQQNLNNIRTSAVQRGLGGSEALMSSERKTASGLQDQANTQVSNLRQNAINKLNETIAGLNMKGGLLKEGKRDQFGNFKNNAMQNIFQLQNAQAGLESQAKANPWLAALSGAAGGIGTIASGFFKSNQQNTFEKNPPNTGG